MANQCSLTKRNRVYTDWYAKLNQTNSDGAMFWLLSGRQDNGSLYPDYDNFTVYYPENSSTCTIIKNYSTTVAAKSGIAFDNTPPTITITSPANNANVSGKSGFQVPPPIIGHEWNPYNYREGYPCSKQYHHCQDHSDGKRRQSRHQLVHDRVQEPG